MNRSNVEAFLMVVSTKSISRAAEALYSSQSTVSLQLKTLESQLGVTLIERRKGHRQIELTQKGQEFISIAERYIQLHREADTLRGNDRTTISVCGANSLHVYAFSEFYERVSEDVDWLNLKIFTYNTAETYERVDNWEVDIGFVHGVMNYRNVQCFPIFHDRFRLVTRGQLPGARKGDTSIHPQSLDFRDEIRYRWWGMEYAQWHNTWCPPGVQAVVEVDTIALATTFLKGAYWAILPASIADMLCRAHPLTVLELEIPPPDRTCYLIRHRQPKSTHLAGIQIFEEKLQQYLVENGFPLATPR